MNAWSGDPVPDQFIHGTTALERQGALVFQVKQCRNCHSLGDTGGQRGPALDSCRRAAYAGPTHPAGDPGRRQHACLWKQLESGGNHGACGVPRDSASRNTKPGP